MALDLVGVCTLKLEVSNKVLYHDDTVVKDLPVDFIIGGEIMKAHISQLNYTLSGRNVLNLTSVSCNVCEMNKSLLECISSPLLTRTFGADQLVSSNL